MYDDPRDDAGTAPDERARRALILRDRGDTYATIGRQLGVSRGNAHHLVKAGLERRVEAALEVARPPGATREPTPERGRELLGRLRRDLDKVDHLLALHFDHGEEQAEFECSRGERTRVDFEAGIGGIEAELAPPTQQSQPGPRRKGKARAAAALRAVERSFIELLKSAVAADESLRREVGQDFVLWVFDRDLVELADILRVPFDPTASLDRPPSLGTAPTDEDEASAPGASRLPLDAPGRARRNERIVTARLGGAAIDEVAKHYGVSPRQVRRLMAAHREGRFAGAQASFDAASGALKQIARDREDLGELGAAADTKTRIRIACQRARLLEREVSVMREAGMISPEAFAAAQQVDAAVADARIEWTRNANRRVRALLEEHDIAPQVIEDAIDQILIAAGFEESGPEREKGRTMSGREHVRSEAPRPSRAPSRAPSRGSERRRETA